MAEFFLVPCQLLFCEFQVGDVCHHGKRTAEMTGAVIQRRTGDQEPAGAAILPDKAAFILLALPGLTVHFPEQVILGIVRSHEIGNILSQHLTFSASKKFGEFFVDEGC
ncbi:MAG: hypothetical protein LUQ66_04080 [Methanoregula sp.]|nr:hypothetical protein [Methanoregula sp.]